MQHTYAPGDEGYKIVEKLPVEDVYLYYDPSLLGCAHNYSCPVCRKNHAVWSNGIMTPCWSCREEGYALVKKDLRPWWKKIL